MKMLVSENYFKSCSKSHTSRQLPHGVFIRTVSWLIVFLRFALKLYLRKAVTAGSCWKVFAQTLLRRGQ